MTYTPDSNNENIIGRIGGNIPYYLLEKVEAIKEGKIKYPTRSRYLVSQK